MMTPVPPTPAPLPTPLTKILEAFLPESPALARLADPSVRWEGGWKEGLRPQVPGPFPKNLYEKKAGGAFFSPTRPGVFGSSGALAVRLKRCSG